MGRWRQSIEWLTLRSTKGWGKHMPLNDKKIISIIFEQCDGLEERCEGYKEEIVEMISDILEYERGHRVSATNIQKKINDKCNAAAQFLATQRDQSIDAEELDS